MDRIHYTLTVSSELNARLEHLAAAGGTTTSTLLTKAFLLYDIASQAQAKKHSIGILDQDKHLLQEIMGI